ncbi:leucine-rich repeat domain-containing protein [Paenibacillus terreus]|uniref:Leucine-rich repeat domain-containing protein n=1 Tax=Paenibacillus terreus TaxID=1387834 RepID=A0ABV5BL69_9BACL
MKIWMLITTDKCLKIDTHTLEEYDDKIRAYVKGEKKEWEPVHMVTKRKGTKSDCAKFIFGEAVFNKKAVDFLQPLIEGQVEFLPLTHEEHELFFVNVTSRQDFVDMSNPVQHKISIGFFSEYIHIFPDKIDPNIHIFRIPQHHSSRVYVSDTFKSEVEKHKLKGFDFVLIWDTENLEEMRKAKLKRYDKYHERISSRPQLSFTDALQKVEQEGNLIRRDDKIFINRNSRLLYGNVNEDESIEWGELVYIPPLFFDLEWIVYEENNVELAIREYLAELSFDVNGPRGKPVHIPDEKLETYFRRELQIYKEELTDLHLKKLLHVRLNKNEGPFNSLKGIEAAVNLRGLSILDTPNFNLNELYYVTEKIGSLSLSGCNLYDISYLEELKFPHLIQIYLYDNRLSNLSPLSNFTGLRSIHVSNNWIEDISSLNQLSSLDYLHIANNPIRNISDLKLPNLTYLYMENIQSEDWSGLLNNFPSLKYLQVSDEGMTEANRKTIREVIKKKFCTVSWKKASDGLYRTYNPKFSE